MRKVLLTTTAFIALGSVAAVAADISISGNTRFRYNSWSDDNAAVAGENNNSMTDVLQLWVKSSATTDGGMSIGTNTRILTTGAVDRNWIDIDGDFGKIDLGKQWSLSYSGSMHEVDGYRCWWRLHGWIKQCRSCRHEHKWFFTWWRQKQQS